jgi:signal peptidase I
VDHSGHSSERHAASAPVAPPVGLDLAVPAPEPVEPPEPPSILLVVPEKPVRWRLSNISGMRRLMEAVVLFVGMVLFLRAMAVEPFGVPTGSMAPTLTGNHRCSKCPRCGYPVRVGSPLQTNRGVTLPPCPNCGQTDLTFDGLPDIAGDRLLVDKNVFCLRKPRRWEVAVFRCPSDLSKPYVKRVVALPWERILIREGDVYINSVLTRKDLVDCRQTAIPIFEMSYVPDRIGWTARWALETIPDPLAAIGGEPLPVSAAVDGSELRLDGANDSTTALRAIYRHASIDTNTESGIRDWFAYNGVQQGPTNAVHDFYAEFEIEVQAGAGDFSCQLTDGRDEMTAHFGVGDGSDQTRLVQENSGMVRRSDKRLVAGDKYRIEMALVDRRVSVAIDGREVFSAFDLPDGIPRAEVSRPLRLEVKGVSAVIRKLKLCRDIYYRQNGHNGVRENEPYSLNGDEYFMLGDNSANSDDSRSWERPGVPERNFLGKPFLLHQPSRLSRFDFAGRAREFQSIDWDRIRWLR